ncbi:hypothetical protein [Streptomyces sp. SS8]
MGIMLFPGDGDVTSPDVSWSYSGFSTFGQWLAQAEGFTLAEMYGFGGDRPWDGVSTPLARLLDHPDDDGPNLTHSQCTAMLPRLEEIISQQHNDGDPKIQRLVDDARRLVNAMKICVDKEVELIFN